MSALADAMRALVPLAQVATRAEQGLACDNGFFERFRAQRDVLRKHAPCGRCAGRGDLCEPECAQPCGAMETCDLCSGAGFTAASVEAAIARAEERERWLVAIEAATESAWPVDEMLSRLADATEFLLHKRNSDRLGHELDSAAAKAARAFLSNLSAHVAPDRGGRGEEAGAFADPSRPGSTSEETR